MHLESVPLKPQELIKSSSFASPITKIHSFESSNRASSDSNSDAENYKEWSQQKNDLVPPRTRAIHSMRRISIICETFPSEDEYTDAYEEKKFCIDKFSKKHSSSIKRKG